MSKEINPIVIVVLLIVGVLLVSQTELGSLFGLEDYILIGEDAQELTDLGCLWREAGGDHYQCSKYWEVDGRTYLEHMYQESTDFRATFKSLITVGGNYEPIYANSKANIKNKNFRINWEGRCFQDNQGYGGGNLRIQVGDLTSEIFRVGTSVTKGSAELIVDPVEEGKAEVYLNGRFQGNVTYLDLENVKLKFILNCENVLPRNGEQYLILESPRYRAPYDDCPMDANDVKVSHTFEAREIISLESDIFNQYPLKRFCLGLPAQIEDIGRGGIATSGRIYLRILRGEQYEVGEGDRITIFYIYDNPNGALQSCDEGYTLNLLTLRCESIQPLIPEEPIGVSEGADFTYQSRWEERDEQLVSIVPRLESGNFYFAPQVPRENSVSVNTNLGSFTFSRGQEIQLTNYIKVKNLDIIEESSSTFEFDINEDEGLLLDLINEEAPIKNQPYDIKVEFTNNLGTGINSGIQINKEYLTLRRTTPSEQFTENIQTGNSVVNIPLDTSELGVISITARPFIEFNYGNTILKTSSSLTTTRNYEITSDGTGEVTDSEIIYIYEEIEGETKIVTETKIPTWVYIIGGILLLLIIFGVFKK